MTLPLMPKATAVWLIDKTALTFDQIADFCGMHPLEIQAIADADERAAFVSEKRAEYEADVDLVFGAPSPFLTQTQQTADVPLDDDPIPELALT